MAAIGQFAVRANLTGPARIGVVQAISIGGPTGSRGSSLGLHLQNGVSRSDIEGSPDVPSVRLAQVGFWRFLWVAKSPGRYQIQVNVKQVINLPPRPSLVIKANPDIGLSADVVGDAPDGADWVTIGPLTVNTTVPGATYIELHNNYAGDYADCFFDHIVET
jgi:hypothetical protein